MAVYPLLLFLYPAGFRTQYGGELCSLFARRLQETSNPFSLFLLNSRHA